MKFMRFLEGFLLGGLIGAGAMILMTPESGQEFRSKFQQELERISGEVKSAALERRTELEEQLAALRTP